LTDPPLRITSRPALTVTCLAVAAIGHAGYAGAVERQAGHLRAGDHPEIGPFHRRAEEGPGCRQPPAVVNGEFEQADAFLAFSVEIRIERQADGRADSNHLRVR
jgi:hypothetical protein